jgi:UDP-N-acetylglucosamine transferase subunit ALG13
MTSPQLPLVILVVGTDHHPFDRAVRWVDGWAGRHQAQARVLVQYGTSSPPVHAEGHDLLPVQELDALMSEAAVVVCHGGPGTIMGAREAGVVPVVIPRESRRGEHVDDHQIRFATRVGDAGQVHLVRTEAELDSLIDQAIGGDPRFRLHDTGDDPSSAAVARFATLVERLVGRDER